MDHNFFLNSNIQPQLQFNLPVDCFLNPNLDNSIDQFSQFESTLSSMVSSPVSATNSSEGYQMQQLIGKLGTVCHNGDTSCYNTPINSPMKLNYQLPNSVNLVPNYPPVQGDPGFAERAAKFSCFGSRSFNGRTGELGLGQNNVNGLGDYRSSPLVGNSVKLTRVSSSPLLNDNHNRVESEQNQALAVPAQVLDSNSKKRKAASKGKSKETKAAEQNVISKSKRLKDNEGSGSENGSKTEENGSDKEEAKANMKPPEPPKDYIHVRARRGQATDSHSLAERVRREKISERMKLLQDLVPGCNKVTGKALMLDEIINYVQSLQRQVEFLSMKLATVNPRLDFNMDGLLSKDVMQTNGTVGIQLDTFFGHHHPNQKLTQLCNNNNNISNVTTTFVDPIHNIFHQNIGLQLQSSHLDEFSHGLAKFQTLCEDDLQSIVGMGHGSDMVPNSQGLHGSNQASHMKLEL